MHCQLTAPGLLLLIRVQCVCLEAGAAAPRVAEGRRAAAEDAEPLPALCLIRPRLPSTEIKGFLQATLCKVLCCTASGSRIVPCSHLRILGESCLELPEGR